MDNMTVRKNLGKKKSRTWIDMEKVYRNDRNTGCRVTWCIKSHSVQASQGIPETGRVHE